MFNSGVADVHGSGYHLGTMRLIVFSPINVSISGIVSVTICYMQDFLLKLRVETPR